MRVYTRLRPSPHLGQGSTRIQQDLPWIDMPIMSVINVIR